VADSGQPVMRNAGPDYQRARLPKRICRPAGSADVDDERQRADTLPLITPRKGPVPAVIHPDPAMAAGKRITRHCQRLTGEGEITGFADAFQDGGEFGTQPLEPVTHCFEQPISTEHVWPEVEVSRWRVGRACWQRR